MENKELERTGCAMIVAMVLVFGVIGWILIDAGNRIRVLEQELKDIQSLEKEVRELRDAINRGLAHE